MVDGRERIWLLAFSDLRSKGDILGSAALDLLLRRHDCGRFGVSVINVGVVQNEIIE